MALAQIGPTHQGHFPTPVIHAPVATWLRHSLLFMRASQIWGTIRTTCAVTTLHDRRWSHEHEHNRCNRNYCLDIGSASTGSRSIHPTVSTSARVRLWRSGPTGAGSRARPGRAASSPSSGTLRLWSGSVLPLASSSVLSVPIRIWCRVARIRPWWIRPWRMAPLVQVA